MILKVHVKYLMDWINSAFVVLWVDIFLSEYGNFTDGQKTLHWAACFLMTFPCAFHQKKALCMSSIAGH